MSVLAGALKQNGIGQQPTKLASSQQPAIQEALCLELPLLGPWLCLAAFPLWLRVSLSCLSLCLAQGRGFGFPLGFPVDHGARLGILTQKSPGFLS